MKLFLHYLRSKALKIGAFLLFALLFLVSFRLYHLPLAAVWYPSALCAALGLVILLLDFRRVRQRHPVGDIGNIPMRIYQNQTVPIPRHNPRSIL